MENNVRDKIENKNENKIENKIGNKIENKVKVNDYVYFFKYDLMYSGKVERVVKDEVIEVKTEYGCIPVSRKDCFLNEKECLEKYNEKFGHKVEKYMGMMNSMEDMIRFMMENPVCGDDRDEMALEAVKRKCGEFGIK